MGRRPRRRYHSATAVTASGSGRPGSPRGRAELARPVKPSAARSSHSPSGLVSGACQCRAAARSSASILGSGIRGQRGAGAAAADLDQASGITAMFREGALAGALDGEAGVGDHLQVAGAGLALAGQVVAEEDRVDDVQRQRLEAAQVDLAPAGQPDLGVRAGEPDHGQAAQAALRGQAPLAAQRGALERDQEVDRDRVGVEFSEREHYIYEFFVGLPHPGDQARARGQAGLLGLGHGVGAVGVVVGGADVFVVALGGVEVVVVGGGAGLVQPLGLAVGEQAQAGAYLDVGVLLPEPRDRGGDAGDVGVVRAPAAGHQADPLGARLDAGLGAADDLVRLEPGVLQHVGGRAEPLRAVEAVLGAQAALDVDQVVQLDPAAEVAQPDLEGRRHHVHQLVVAALQDVEGLGAGGQFPGEGFGGQRVQPGHGATLARSHFGPAERGSVSLMRVAILDDYQQVSLASADWSPVRSLGTIDVFAQHIARTEALVSALEPYDVVVAMRERTYFDADRLGQLPRLRLLVTTVMGNASIDLSAAAARGVTVCGTGGIGSATAELTWGLILALL